MNNDNEFPEYLYDREDHNGDACDENDAGDENGAVMDNVAGVAKSERIEEFAFILLLLVMKVSLFFIQQYCEEKGYTTTLFEIFNMEE